MFKFTEGDVVAHREGRPDLNLRTGGLGVVWCMYAITPPAYEVTFWDSHNQPFDLLVYEDEVSATDQTAPVFERPVFEPEAVVSVA